MGTTCSQIERCINKEGLNSSSSKDYKQEGLPNSLRVIDGNIESRFGFLNLSFKTDKWSVVDANVNPAVEFSFLHKSREAHAALIVERISTDLDNYYLSALKFMHVAGNNIKVISKVHSHINGLNVITAEFEADISGMRMYYHNLYWAGKAGCFQLMTYCSPIVANEYTPDLLEFF
jgi:hypothetical protein